MRKKLQEIKQICIYYIDCIRYQYYYNKLSKYALSKDRKTSISDDDVYPALCLAASKDDTFFKNFRRNFIYNRILEHVSKDLGQEYLNIINRNTNVLFTNEDWDKFCKNDLYGNPRMYSYKVNNKNVMLSPTTLRYIKVLQDILSLYDMSQIKSIAEIGIGYAGQCRIITDYMENIKAYSLFDLPEVLKLAKKYLNMFGDTNRIKFIDGTQINVNDKYDFVISNYAFSELIREVQDIYLDKVILRSKSGYITWNSISYTELDGYSLNELLNKIPNSSVIAESPLTADNNCIIIWGTK